jgi:hypothetical protein
MCDYSLMQFPNRLAVNGEELIVHRFLSGSIGLASAADLQQTSEPRNGRYRSWWSALKNWFLCEDERCVTAVCIPPAARLVLHDSPPHLRSKYGVQAQEEVTFMQLSADVNTYRDALRFCNGQHVKLQELCEGQRITVLDLGGEGNEVDNLAQDRVAPGADLVPAGPRGRRIG